ncbi:ABC transporter permease [Desulfogranum japonicum]|uniref:ABC transporter permease n=1 Tax=Desulfogranum japonicum TaxID=231447 RepID=UPI000419B5DB|nr:iron ABC transporter permease [Desulfogranum japonicum]
MILQRVSGIRVFQYSGVCLLLLFLFGYILFPTLKTVETSVYVDGAFSLVHYLELFTVPAYRVPLYNSILLGILTVVVCGCIGVALAFVIHYFDFPCRGLMDKLLLLPMVMPGIVIVLAFVQLYGESGMITKTLQLLFHLESPPFHLSGLPGILIVHAYTQYVYFYITVSIAIRHIDFSIIESARNLGASRRKVFVSIILPFLRPALLAASAMTFISGAGSFTAPSIIGGGFKVLTTQILLSKTNNYMDIAATQVTVLTLVCILFFIIFRIYEAKSTFTSSVRGGGFQPITIRSQTVRWMLMSCAGLLVISIFLPVASIVLVSFVPSSSWMINYFPQDWTFDNYIAIGTSARKMQPFVNSSVMALSAAMAGLIVALPASFIIEKTASRFRWVVEFLVMLPWAIPCSAIAINMINAFNTPSLFSGYTVLVGSTILLPLAYCIRSLPILVKTVNVSLQNLNHVYLEASKSLGATTVQTFRRIAFPIVFPGILAGFLLVCLRSIGEYTVSVFLYTAANKPMSIAMVNGVFEYNLGLAMAYGTLLILLSFVVSLVSTRLLTFSIR